MYQIPKQADAIIIRGESKISLRLCTPEKALPIKNTIVTMVFVGTDASPYSMRLNVYAGPTNRKLLLSSDIIESTDLVRGENHFCELRFDFSDKTKLSNITNGHLIEFEIFGGYSPSSLENYIGLLLDYDTDYGSLITSYAIDRASIIPIRSSLFFERD
jgi:hypothetical protein